VNFDTWTTLREQAGRLDADRLAVLVRVAAALEIVGPNASRLLDDVAAGLVLGVTYGDWTDQTRAMVREALAEGRDGTLYVTAEIRQTLDRLATLTRAREHFVAAHAELVAAE
jgi:hypothetical protein